MACRAPCCFRSASGADNSFGNGEDMEASAAPRSAAIVAGPLSRRQIGAYAALEFPFTLLTAPILAVLPPLYAKEHGIGLASLSLVLLLLRVTDAATDPLVGIWSDRTITRWGARKPFILAGAALATWCAWSLFVPPEDPGVFHIGVWLCGLYLGWTLIEVPYRAWSADMAPDYDDRARVALAVRVVGSVALLAFGFLPLIFSPTNEFDFAVLKTTATILLVAMPVATVITLMAPTGAPAATSSPLRLTLLADCVRANPALRIWLITLAIGYLGIGTAGALFFVLFDTYLGIGRHFTLISTTSQLVALASVPLWAFIITRFEKRTVLVIGLAGIAATLPILHFIRPGPMALPIYMLNDALWYSFLMAFEIAIFAMIGDLADSEQARAGDGRAGLIAASMAFLRKAMYGLGAAIAYGITGLAGYDPAAESNTDLAIFSLQSVNGMLPAVLCGVAALVALRYPLTRARQQAIASQLADA